MAKKFLAKFGISSVNNLVDATNYFMITTGQPLHAFDYNLIDKSKIFISDKIDSEIETLSNVLCKTKGFFLFQMVLVQLQLLVLSAENEHQFLMRQNAFY